MTDYKLMPLEPTREMLAAGDYSLEAGCYASGIYADMLDAAPDVQGEPVAYAVFAGNGNIRIWCADPIQVETLRQQYGEELQPLYTAPQPAPDVAGLVDALEGLLGVIGESRGVSGYHLNGEIAEWDDLQAAHDATAALAAHRKGGDV